MKRDWIGWVVGVVSAGVVGACWGQVAKVPAVDLKDAGAVGRLVGELSDENPVVREEGQRELERLPVAGLPELVKLAEQTADAEAKARLQARVEEMKGILALNPTRMAFDFDNLGVVALEKELQKETRLRFVFSGGGGYREKYSLHVKGMGWNDVMMELSAQHPMAPYIVSTDIELMDCSDGAPEVLSSRGALVGLGYVHVDKTAEAGKEVEELLVPVSVMVDPRAKLLGTSDARLRVDLSDSNKRFEESDGPGRNAVRAGVPGWSRLYTFKVPRGLTGPVHIAGQVKLTASVEDERLEIDAGKRLNEEVRFGGQVVKVTKFAVGPGSRPRVNSLVIALEAKNDPEFPGERTAKGISDPVLALLAGMDESVTATVVDAMGIEYGSFTIRGQDGWKGGGTLEGAFMEPLKVVLSRRVPPREVVVPFDFKGVAVAH